MAVENIKKIGQKINVFRQCDVLGFSLWQCPSFLFVVMGLVNIIAMIGTYFIASRFSNEPELVAIIVIIVSFILLIIGVLLVENFNKVVEANRLKSEFVSIASHQLRAPISSIRWTLDLILGKRLGDVNPKVVEYLESARSSAKRMASLINDILDLRHIEKGRFGDKNQLISVHDVAEKVFSDLRSFAEASNVDLSFEDNSNGDSLVKANPEELKLIIQNLVENGIKYIKGGGFVKLGVKKAGNRVMVIVQDSGAGIPDADKHYIFERFFRASNARVIQTEGTGLGLFIAKSIVEGLGGRIGFDSEEGKGSTFWFYLPSKK
jgi:signal transduction histidine kinase